MAAYQLEKLVCQQLSLLTPERMRLPSRRQLVADFAPLWAQLGEYEKMKSLGQVVDRVFFDAGKQKLKVTIGFSAVGAVGGILMARTSGPR